MTDWLVETGFAVTILMLLVLAARRPVAHFFGAGWAYALWLLPALRLVLPPLHLFGADMPSLLPQVASAVPEAGTAVVTLDSSVVVAAAFDWEPVLLGMWVAGAALFVLWHAWSYLSFMRRLGIGSQVEASLAQDVGVIESKEVDGPIAIGLLDRWIVVPTDFSSRYSPEEQRLALQHEHIHHQREDIFWNMVALGVLALNWFNPVAYAAFRAFRADQELSCDAAVAAQASRHERADYASALVKSAAQPGLVAGCPLNGADQLKRRLRMMKEHRRSSLRALGGSSAVAALLLAGISATEAREIPALEAFPAPVTKAAPATPIPAAAPAPKAVPAPRQARIAERHAPAALPPAAVESAAIPAPAAEPAPPASAEAPAAPVARIFTIRTRGRDSEKVVVRMEPQHFAMMSEAHPVTEVRVIRAHFRSAADLTPEMRERLERLVARQIALRDARISVTNNQ